MLLHSPLLRYVKGETLAEQYKFLRNNITQDSYALDDQSVIAPVQFDLMRSDVRNVVNWINKNIVLNLDKYLYFPGNLTLMVTLRIATGMINKLTVAKNIRILMHDSMIDNITKELALVDASTLPF